MKRMQRTPSQVTGYRIEEMDGELLLFHPESTATVYMNQTAALVWQLCDGERPIQDIVDILNEGFAETGQDLKSDIRKALESFKSHGALTY
jgi:hypothetical protein